MQKQFGAVRADQPGFEKELQNPPADTRIEIERAINKLELSATPVEQRLHLGNKRLQRKLPHGNIEGREAELAFVGTAARRLDIHDAMGQILVRVKRIRKRQIGRSGNTCGNDFLSRSVAREKPFT